MIYNIPTRYEELTLKIKVRTFGPETIRIVVADADQPNTTFTDRYRTFHGESVFFVRMPVSSQSVNVYVFNDNNGNLKAGADDSFEVVSISKEPLDKKLDVIDFANPYIRGFVNFCTRFAYNCGTLPSGTYVSDDKNFVIKYLPVIHDGGNEASTPARVDIDTGVMEVSKRQFIDYSVPNRVAILLHEFSHIYLNDNIDDEIEADLNGLLIYLGLGYPRIEASEVFAKTFLNNDTELNQKRYERILNFIDDFDRRNSFMYQ